MRSLIVGVAVLLSTTSVFAKNVKPRIPGVPSNVTATATSPSSVRITWNDNSIGETGFRIERSRDEINWNNAGQTAADVTSFDDNNVTDNTMFFYRVMAFDADGETNPSNVASATTPQGFWSISGKVVEGNDFQPVGGATITVERGANFTTPLYTPNKQIPDSNTTGITETFAISRGGLVDQLTFTIKLTHRYLSDMIVTLIHPDGTKVILHNRGSSSLDTTYPTITAPYQSLDALKGKPIAGTWSLHLADVVGSDIGTLHSFQMTLTGASETLTTTSDAGGFYSFANVPSGSVLMWVDAPGLQFNGREVDLRGHVTRMNFVSDIH